MYQSLPSGKQNRIHPDAHKQFISKNWVTQLRGQFEVCRTLLQASNSQSEANAACGLEGEFLLPQENLNFALKAFE